MSEEKIGWDRIDEATNKCPGDDGICYHFLTLDDNDYDDAQLGAVATAWNTFVAACEKAAAMKSERDGEKHWEVGMVAFPDQKMRFDYTWHEEDRHPLSLSRTLSEAVDLAKTTEDMIVQQH